MSELITINFDRREMRVILSSMNEYGGGSASSVKRLSGHAHEVISSAISAVDEQRSPDVESITLREDQWRVIYDSINATIYALGPFELETCTGCNPIDMLETNLSIASHVWGAYGKAKWRDYYKAVRL